MWRERDIPDGYLAGIFDGKIWKEWQYVSGQPYLALPLGTLDLCSRWIGSSPLNTQFIA